MIQVSSGHSGCERFQWVKLPPTSSTRMVTKVGGCKRVSISQRPVGIHFSKVSSIFGTKRLCARTNHPCGVLSVSSPALQMPEVTRAQFFAWATLFRTRHGPLSSRISLRDGRADLQGRYTIPTSREASSYPQWSITAPSNVALVRRGIVRKWTTLIDNLGVYSARKAPHSNETIRSTSVPLPRSLWTDTEDIWPFWVDLDTWAEVNVVSRRVVIIQILPAAGQYTTADPARRTRSSHQVLQSSIT